jgi:hypothetical protein
MIWSLLLTFVRIKLSTYTRPLVPLHLPYGRWDRFAVPQRREHFYPRCHFALPIRLCLQSLLDRLRIEVRIDGGMSQALVVQYAVNGRDSPSMAK